MSELTEKADKVNRFVDTMIKEENDALDILGIALSYRIVMTRDPERFFETLKDKMQFAIDTGIREKEVQ